MSAVSGAKVKYDAAEPKKAPVRAVLSAIVLFAVAAALIAGAVRGELLPPGLARAWDSLTGRDREALFLFEDGFDDVFADLGSAVVSAGTLGVAVYGGTGGETARESFAMANPAIASKGALAVVYDAGGRSVKVVDGSGVVASLPFESAVVSCSVGSGGIFAVTTRGTGVYKGRVEFFKLTGGVPEIIYDWSSRWPVLGAAVSRSGKLFAALTLTAQGGRIVLMERRLEEPRGEYVHQGGTIFEMTFMDSGTLIARADKELISISENGEGRIIYDFNGRELDGYSGDGGAFIVMHFARPGGGGELVTVDERGAELGRLETSSGLVWLSASGDRVAVLQSDGLDIYDRELRLVSSYPEASGASAAFPRGGGAASALGAREGRVLSGKKAGAGG
ncbi:MAG: DUF5711 family protein [Oscillospiraceae bacterium]|jgi:hypothetical protein|nr:DUF5711 family protein [Oscillospiraceae bacterium]